MPLVIHPRVRTAIGRVAAMTCVAVFAGSGAASAACAPQPLSTPFAGWGDTSSYFLVPGGSFEGPAGQLGWDLSNAGPMAGNAPAAPGVAAGDQSLEIDAGGSATSPAFCVDSTMPDLRFFARQTEPGAGLVVEGLVQARWQAFRLPISVIADGSMPAWGPVQRITLPTHLLPGWARVPAEVRFVVPGAQGAWEVDDVYVDPFRAG